MTQLWRSKEVEDVKESLKFLRQNRSKDSENVVYYGYPLIKKNSSSLEHIELWEIYEQVYVAALECHNDSIANELLDKIINKHGAKSLRVLTLIGMSKEQKQEYKEAENIYNQILQIDPSHQNAMRRQISLRKEVGDTEGAIKLLNDYLKIFMGDIEAWLELADIFINLQMYKNALPCFEEAMLAHPHNHHLFSRYAEVLYAVGGYEAYKMARKNFAHSYELCEKGNHRSLFGILMCSIAVAATKQGRGEKDNETIFQWALDQLKEEYKREDPSKLKFLDAYVLTQE